MSVQPGPLGLPQTTSLYKQSVATIEQLYAFAPLQPLLFPAGLAQTFGDGTLNIVNPIHILWPFLRFGSPLCILANYFPEVQPKIVVPPLAELGSQNACKKMVYAFLVACITLGLSDGDLFAVSDIFKDDTNVLVKILRTVDILLSMLKNRGLLPPPCPLPFQSLDADLSDNRSKIIYEILQTERVYIAQLETLVGYRESLLSKNVISKDTAHILFGNLIDLLDFQRRILMWMETTIALGDEHRIGLVFIQNAGHFSQFYGTYCSNFDFASNTLMEEIPALSKLPHETFTSLQDIQSYLIKPIQRICRYPLLLKELYKLSESSSYLYLSELNEGYESVTKVAEEVNEIKRQQELQHIKTELVELVDDWKGLQLSDLGELLLHNRIFIEGVDETASLYLFHNALLGFRDNPGRKIRVGQREEAALVLVGLVYISCIQVVQDVSRSDASRIKVFWRDERDSEMFVLKLRSQEQYRQWKEQLEQLLERFRNGSARDSGYSASTTPTARPSSSSSGDRLRPSSGDPLAPSNTSWDRQTNGTTQPEASYLSPVLGRASSMRAQGTPRPSAAVPIAIQAPSSPTVSSSTSFEGINLARQGSRSARPISRRPSTKGGGDYFSGLIGSPPGADFSALGISSSPPVRRQSIKAPARQVLVSTSILNTVDENPASRRMRSPQIPNGLTNLTNSLNGGVAHGGEAIRQMLAQNPVVGEAMETASRASKHQSISKLQQQQLQLELLQSELAIETASEP
ncbi:uncharacterized protein BJ171DRAFT_263822 [Polychytrium aggregatum]|uniref:uncharacterized protein n=1 Tax=Polychytrium aggregatum TaxID=110093 RepID=UPI0022FE6C7D|nr:uncharacterized protein BJ171DRAFT_263822 [Polychytrium aggregatum]KAI9193487.1 hypothetical protein BJ171DRAFT_263822 [Polychytrium aggregatum]